MLRSPKAGRVGGEALVLFPTVTFAIFFTVVFVGVWALPRYSRIWKLFILAAGGVFYAWWDVRFLALLGSSILVNHVAAFVITRHAGWSRRGLWVGIAANLTLLGFFKYYEFFTDSLHQLLEPLGLDPSLPVLDIVLPVGISFFTFEAIAYLIELRRGAVEPLSLLDFATYLSFFPKLTSGPITRPSEFAPQLEGVDDRQIQAPRAFWLIARGLFKKVVIASYLGEALVDGLFATPGQYSAGETLIGIYAYTAQIYVDFSGYTDMAIGLALLLGFRLPENFRAPYRALSIRDFWSRWHMSLTRWIRDFMFWPLSKRSGHRRHAAAWNMFMVMVLIGLWHGAGWTFVVWGGIHGLGLAAERVTRVLRRNRRRVRPESTPVRRGLRWFVTFHVVALAWVFFRAHTLGDAMAVFARLGDLGPTPSVTWVLLVVLAFILAVQFLPDDWTDRRLAEFGRLHPAVQGAALGLMLLVIDVFGPEGVAPFIYFRF